MTTEPRTRRERRKARNEATTAARVDALLHDTTYDWLRTRRTRQVLAAALVIVIAGVSTSFWLGRSLIATAGLIVGVVLWLLLRVAVRTIADLPDEFLDERLARVRDRSYFEAYSVLATIAILVPMAGMLWFILTGAEPEGVDVTVTIDQFQAAFWLLLGAALSLPSIVVALRETDI